MGQGSLQDRDPERIGRSAHSDALRVGWRGRGVRVGVGPEVRERKEGRRSGDLAGATSGMCMLV